MSSFDPARFNPMRGNPLKTRADLQKALLDLVNPLLPYFSDGGARVRLSGAAAHFDRTAGDLEGFARPLWGIAPFAAGGGEFPHWELYRRGLANGVNPKHPEYWGNIKNVDQRLVELAAIGFALAMVPQHLWQPLDDAAKANVIAYLLQAHEKQYAPNNWQFFRVLIDLGLASCGVSVDPTLTNKSFDDIDSFYVGDGWYRDGRVRHADHYVPFALHLYGLIYARLQRGDDERARQLKERAARIATDIRHWFDDEGGAVAFGRSLTYRFACGAFWGGLAFANVEARPWGEIKGYLLRHLRWWSKLPIADRDGVLSIGYGYPNLMMSESYNSAGGPYWALKVFLPLALPENHPFWTAREEPATFEARPVPLRHPGMVMMHTAGNVTALSSGQENLEMRAGTEKYAKFAYSSRYAFSVEVSERNYDHGAFDNMLAFSDDDRHYRVREDNRVARIARDVLYSMWLPWNDVTVETWLLPSPPWHIRIHRIITPRPLRTTEGGFAIAIPEIRAIANDGLGFAIFRTKTDVGAIADLLGVRRGRNLIAPPNSNLLSAKTVVPQLRGDIPIGVTVLETAVLGMAAGPDADAALKLAPRLPELAQIEALMKHEGVDVSVMKPS